MTNDEMNDAANALIDQLNTYECTGAEAIAILGGILGTLLSGSGDPETAFLRITQFIHQRLTEALLLAKEDKDNEN